MANIRAAYALSSVLLATPAAATVSADVSTHSITALARPNQVIAVSAFVVPMEYLEEQTVTMSDFRAFDINKVLIDVVTMTDTNNVSFAVSTSLTDSVAIVENSIKIFNGTIDFDLTDPDTDPDPINIADADEKEVGKTLTEALTASDVDVKTVGQVSTDAVTASETINTKDVGKSLTDATAAADTINQFNTDKVVADSATATDAAAKDFTRPDVVDSVTTADDSSRQPELGKTETVTASDAFGPFDIGVNPSDAVTASDAVDSFAVTTVLADSVEITDFIAKTPGYEFDFDVTDADADADPVTMTEVMAKDFTRPDITDSASATDAIANNPDLSKTDTVTATDSDAKSFDTARTESVSATDEAAISTTKVLTDATTGATDALVVEVGSVLADAVTGTDAINTFSVSQVLADTASVTDSLITTLILGQSTPLYDFAFMSDDKFTYFAVPGTINSHLIHQPVVNGEFVLTTDPNAGIVYTIRTESYSYMFAGYGLNENQLN